MSRSNPRARRAARAAVSARSAQASGTIKCFVQFIRAEDGRPNLRLREKGTSRHVRVATGDTTMATMAPLRNLLQDSFRHGNGLIEPRSRNEFILLSGRVITQNADQVVVLFDEAFSATVRIQTTSVAQPPLSLWCYIEEYTEAGGARGLRLRQKVTGRKVEMYGTSKDHLVTFLASPSFVSARDSMPNLYERQGYRDYVLVSGGTAVDSYDVVRFNGDTALTYLLGPTPDTAYRDAFRAAIEESPSTAHARTAATHLDSACYREAVLSARLAVEMACGGNGQQVKRRLTDAPKLVAEAGSVLFDKRNTAVHEGGTRVELQDAEVAVDAMRTVLRFVNGT